MGEGSAISGINHAIMHVKRRRCAGFDSRAAVEVLFGIDMQVDRDVHVILDARES